MTDEDVKELEEKNSRAEEIYASHDKGRDNYATAASANMFLRVQYATNTNPDGNKIETTNLKPYHFRVNNNALYYSNKDSKYRGVFGSVLLKDLVG